MARCVNFHPYYHQVPLEFQNDISWPQSSFFSSSDEEGCDSEVSSILSVGNNFPSYYSKMSRESSPEGDSDPKTSTPLNMSPLSWYEDSLELDEVDVTDSSMFGNVGLSPIRKTGQKFKNHSDVIHSPPAKRARMDAEAEDESVASPSYSAFTPVEMPEEFDTDASCPTFEISPDCDPESPHLNTSFKQYDPESPEYEPPTPTDSPASPDCSPASPGPEAERSPSPVLTGYSPASPYDYRPVTPDYTLGSPPATPGGYATPEHYYNAEHEGSWEPEPEEEETKVIVPTKEKEELPTVAAEVAAVAMPEVNPPEPKVENPNPAPHVIVINTKRFAGTMQLVLEKVELRSVSEENKTLAWHYVFRNAADDGDKESAKDATAAATKGESDDQSPTQTVDSDPSI